MTVSSAVNHQEYTGNGTTTVFPYGFRILKDSHLAVTLSDGLGNLQYPVLGTDYLVSGVGLVEGGNVTLKNPLPSGWRISLDRILPLVQETDLRNQGKFFPEIHEDAFDYLTMLIQRCDSLLGSALRKPSWLSNYYDALGNRISNLSDPKGQQDAVTLSYLVNEIRKVVSASSVDMGYLSNTDSLALGDALIGVRQPFAGAYPRTQHNKNLEVVSVMDFGAVGDGSHDDTAAFQAAAASGARWVVAPRDKLYRFTISDTILISSNSTSFDLFGSEIRMVDSTGLKSHFIVQSSNGTQIQGNVLRSMTLINEYPSTVYQIRVLYAGGLTVEDCTGYSPTYGHVYGFIELGRVVISYIRRNQTERMKDASLYLWGTGTGDGRNVDCTMYDNRFDDGDYGLKATDYVEGIFCRRNIIYAQRVACVGLVAASSASKSISVKLQEIDFDSPNMTGSFVFMRYATNVQITGSWFAGKIASGSMIRLEETDGVLVSDNQAYPSDAFILDNGIGTTILSNMIVGGTVICQFGSLADKTLISSNSIRGAVACVAADQHLKSLSVLNNKFEASSAAITENTTNQSLHTYSGNSGDKSVGSGIGLFMSGSPYTYTVGGHPVILAFKGGTVTNISVNGNQMATSSNVTLGPIPPGAVVQVSYTGAAPGLQLLKTL